MVQLLKLVVIAVGQEVQKQVGKPFPLLNQVIHKIILQNNLCLILDTSPKSKTLDEINGHDSIFYWIDLTTEMAFYLPHHFSSKWLLLLLFLLIFHLYYSG